MSIHTMSSKGHTSCFSESTCMRNNIFLSYLIGSTFSSGSAGVNDDAKKSCEREVMQKIVEISLF